MIASPRHLAAEPLAVNNASALAEVLEMGRIVFTSNLQRHLPCPPAPAEGGTVREVLNRVFAGNPQLRSYLLDDQDRLRQHVNVFVNGEAVADRAGLSDPVRSDDEVFVIQALSGG